MARLTSANDAPSTSTGVERPVNVEQDSIKKERADEGKGQDRKPVLVKQELEEEENRKPIVVKLEDEEDHKPVFVKFEVKDEEDRKPFELAHGTVVDAERADAPEPELSPVPTHPLPFPNEIFARILCYVRNNTDLSAVCLTSRALLHLGRQALYGRLNMSIRQSEGEDETIYVPYDVELLCQSLRVNSELAKAVREICVEVMTGEEYELVDDWVHSVRRWIPHQQQVGWQSRWDEANLTEEEQASRTTFLDPERERDWDGENEDATRRMQEHKVKDWIDFFGDRFPVLPNLRHIDLTLAENSRVAVASPRPSHIFNTLPALTLIDFDPITQSAFPVLDSLTIAYLTAHKPVVASGPPPALTKFCLESYHEYMGKYNDDALAWILSTSHSSLTHLSIATRCNIPFSSLVNLAHLTLYRCGHFEDRRTDLAPVLDGLSPSLLSVTFGKGSGSYDGPSLRKNTAFVAALLLQLPPFLPKLVLQQPGMEPDVVCGLLADQSWLPSLGRLEIVLGAPLKDVKSSWTAEARARLEGLCRGRGVRLVEL